MTWKSSKDEKHYSKYKEVNKKKIAIGRSIDKAKGIENFRKKFSKSLRDWSPDTHPLRPF